MLCLYWQGGVFDYDSIKLKIIDINSILSDSNNWNKLDLINKNQIDLKNFSQLINEYDQLNEQYIGLKDFLDIYDSLDDKEKNELEHNLLILKDNFNKLKIKSLLNKETDDCNAFVEIHAGAGGTESQDWAEMLLRMYERFADIYDYNSKILDYQRGEEAGIKNATILVSGFKSFGYLKNESGIHRLVRISPFDSNKRRHTSFCSIWVYPEINEQIEVEINPKDLRIDTYRASGAGGQHVNKTDSAVRITHLKYNVVVQSQSERSQHRNRDTAMKMLKSRIYEIELDKKNQEKKLNEGNKKEIGWGNQIRSYVLHPYKMIKDLRTNHQTSNVDEVLNGNIFDFLESSLLNLND